MLPPGESVSAIEPCRDVAAASNTPAVTQPSNFEVTKNVAQGPRLSSAYYVSGISKLE